MRLIIEYDNGDTGNTVITKEQCEDIEWLAITTSDTYKPIHELMVGIKNCFEELNDNEN